MCSDFCGNSTDEIDEIEVTPEMVAAGVLSFSEYDCRFERPEELVVRVYCAMREALKR